MDSPLLRSLFDEEERRPLTVSELNEQVKGTLESRFASVWIEGEISDFYDADSGHWYFNLHDSDSQLKAACYKGTNWRIRFKPFDGLQVRVRGKLTLYEPRGEYQILIESLEPAGEGAIKVAYEQVKAKLEKERLFDDEFKRPLPFFPRRIGVVTSPNGAAFHDILNVLSRRTKSVNVVLIPARVQGDTASEEIRKAILKGNDFNARSDSEEKIDVLIIGRGGGSSEDLSAFNEEWLARAIFESRIPVISAVGHEVDTTIADLVADVRAPTPSAAAEIVAEREADLESYVARQAEDLYRIVDYRILRARNSLQEFQYSRVFAGFPQRVRTMQNDVGQFKTTIAEKAGKILTGKTALLDKMANRLTPVRLASNFSNKKTRVAVLVQKSEAAIHALLNGKKKSLKVSSASLEALSPLSVLSRGFSLTQTESGKIVRDSTSVRRDEKVKIRLAKGRIQARITDTE